MGRAMSVGCRSCGLEIEVTYVNAAANGRELHARWVEALERQRKLATLGV